MGMNPQDPSKGRKRFREYNEKDEYYLKKICKLVAKHMQSLAQALEEEAMLKRETEKKQMNRRCKPIAKTHSKPIAKTHSKPIASTHCKPIANTQMLQDYITNVMKGKDVTLVIKKILYSSDLLRNQNRLSMPINQLETHDFLTENEKEDLENGKEFKVELLGPRLEIHGKPMVMTKWHLKSSASYVLKTNWNDFVNENNKDLKVERKIQVWSFRKDKKLYFALACV